MSRALAPRPSLAPGGTAGCWAILLGYWGLAALNGLVWASARIAARLSGGTALLLATGIKSALIHLTPWYARTRAAEITAAQTAAQEKIRAAANQTPPAQPASAHTPATSPQESSS